ncbi:unnamed protein product [Linum trigynum]
MAEVKLKHNIDVKRRTCYRAKVAAIKLLRGSLKDEYKKVRSYLGELKKRDRDGRFVLEVEPHPTQEKVFFQRMFIGTIVKFRGMRIRKRVEKEKEWSRLCIARQTLDSKCEVKMGDSGYIVDLNDKSCTCGYWKLSGVPCCHAVSAISHLRKEVDDYVHPCYHTHHVSEGYKVGIPCLDGRQAWREGMGLPVHPPKQRAMPGRPKKNRRKAAHELETRPQRNGVGEEVTRRGSVIHCSKCGGEGHNARGCKASTADCQAYTRARNTTPAATGRPTAIAGDGINIAAPTADGGNHNTDPTTRKKRVAHCSKCGSVTHNARTCPLNQGAGVQDIRLNVGDRRTIEREMRIATSGVGVYVNEATGNTYVRLAGARGRPVGGSQPTEVDMQGSQPPTMQP